MAVLMTIAIFAQVPQKMSYQAVIRIPNNVLITNHIIGMRISLLQGSATGPAVYIETQTPATNANGLVTVEIGGGTIVTGTFEGIDWSTGLYFIKTETDPAGGTNYTITGTSQLLSVPYAFYAETSGNVTDMKKQINNLEDILIAGGLYKLSDIDGNQYNVVKIGSQVWMKENLKTTKYNDGASIPLVTLNTDWSALTTPAYCWYNNDAATYKDTYGALYNWYVTDAASNGNKNVCPANWHVPSDAEWTTLTNYLGGESVSGGKLKETGTSHWQSPNTGATNESGFSALAGGTRYTSGTFDIIGVYGYWWSSTATSPTFAYYRNLLYNYSYIYRYDYNKRTGSSVRCLRDF